MMSWSSFQRKFNELTLDLRRENASREPPSTVGTALAAQRATTVSVGTPSSIGSSPSPPVMPPNVPDSPFSPTFNVTSNSPRRPSFDNAQITPNANTQPSPSLSRPPQATQPGHIKPQPPPSSPRNFLNTGRFSLGKGRFNRSATYSNTNRGFEPLSSSEQPIHATPVRNNNNMHPALQQARAHPPTLLTTSNSPPSNIFENTSLTFNAACLSPRPRQRPLALPIGNFELSDRSPSRRPLPFNFGNQEPPPVPNPRKSRDELKNFAHNNMIKFNDVRYPCTENDLEYIEELGAGSCGQVAKYRHKPTGNVVAVKQMRRSGDDDETKRIVMDLGVLLKCEYENIVQCHGYLIKDAEVLIVMELMATCFEKFLKKIREPVPEPILGKIAVATVKALNYVKEEHSIIHRDVKPSNILINEQGVIKLCDFGIAGYLVDSKAKTRQAGCAAYMAPERIEPPDPNEPLYDIRADVWSLGITLVEMALGHFPYVNCKTDFEVLTKIVQHDPPTLPRNGQFSDDFCDFIDACLTKNYKHRPKYKKLLKHRFIKEYESKLVDVASWYAEAIKRHSNSVTSNKSPQSAGQVLQGMTPASTSSAEASSSFDTPSPASSRPFGPSEPDSGMRLCH